MSNFTLEMPVRNALAMYTELGFDAIPLIPGSKKPYGRAWQNRPPYRLWQNAPQGANIGIRGGGLAQVAVIDCDTPQTVETVTNWLAGLGYRGDSYPVVQTPSGAGRHDYFTFAGGLSGDWRVLSKEVGAGEFRFGAGSYVAAPPSVIKDGGVYALLSGDFSVLPSLAISDVLQIVNNQETATEHKPVLPRKAVALLHGKDIDGYATKSEAEQALLVSLINAGFGFADVLDLFNRYPCAGKYAVLRTQNPRNAEHWLQHSYNEAVEWAKTHESKARRAAQAAIVWAESKPWPGRTGANDQAAFIAAAQISYKAGRLEFAAACRDVAEQAMISRDAAANALYRLVARYNLLDRVRKAEGDCAHTYRLTFDPCKTKTLPKYSTVRKCLGFAQHDAFRKGRGKKGLGKAAGMVYQALCDCESLTVDELAKQTGRDKRTVKRWLDRMARIVDRKTGEIIRMIETDGAKYHSLPVDLDLVAQVVGTAGKGEVQRIQHAKERDMHKRSLLLAKKCRESHPNKSGDNEKV